MRTITISAKCSDLFNTRLTGKDGVYLGEYDGYVPDWFPNPKEKHYGDYIQLQINLDTGQILNWKKPTDQQVADTFKS